MASPEASLLTDHTAIIVVDVQNDFADPTGALYVPGGEETVAAINELIDTAREAGARVAYTQDWHPAVTPHFEAYGGTWPIHCVAGTWGASLHPDLHVAGPVVKKGTDGEDGYSGFTARDVTSGAQRPTGLCDVLDGWGVSTVIIVGLAEDVCVKETALDARQLGYDTKVLLEDTRPINVEPGDDQRAVGAMEAAGVTVLAALPGPG